MIPSTWKNKITQNNFLCQLSNQNQNNYDQGFCTNNVFLQKSELHVCTKKTDSIVLYTSGFVPIR